MPVVKRTDFSDVYLSTALPALEQLTMDEFDRFPMQHEEIFQVSDMDRGIVQTSQISGIPTLGSVGEAEEYPQDGPVQGFDRTFTAVKYGVIIPVSQESLDDGKGPEIFSSRPQMLADSMNEKMMIEAAAHLNNAFSTTLGDGKVLCATDHPLAYPGLGTSTNKPSTDVDLSISELKNLITIFRQQKDMSGKKINARPTHLVVPAELEFLAHELLESELLPGGSNNNVNSVRSRYGLKVLVMDHLTDADAWFLVNADKNQLRWYWRERPSVSTKDEFKTDVGLIKTKARWASGVADWRYVVGTAGAD